ADVAVHARRAAGLLDQLAGLLRGGADALQAQAPSLQGLPVGRQPRVGVDGQLVKAHDSPPPPRPNRRGTRTARPAPAATRAARPPPCPTGRPPARATRSAPAPPAPPRSPPPRTACPPAAADPRPRAGGGTPPPSR